MLETRNLSVFYGRHKALENVSVQVNKGEICVVLGANGAGKSTLLKAVAGLVTPAPGSQVIIDGRPISGLNSAEIVETGIALVPEGRGIFADLTVQENLTLGAYARRARRDEGGNLKRVFALFPRLAERRAQIARTMSGGEQQMVAIGRALMSRPDILMLDEPSLGLSPLLCTELFKTLKGIGETGVGILLVEQNAKQSLAIADRGYLLENGHIIGEDTAEALAGDPAVRRAYLGAAAEAVPVAPANSASTRELSQMAEGFASRAAELHSAHIAGLRAVGTAAASASGIQANPDARALAGMAADLAAHAADIQSAHIRARRAPETTEPPAAAPSSANKLSAMASDLAKRAGEIHSAHIRARRAKG
jgi:branched-chain amino acid transport system ATP-binding protein